MTSILLEVPTGVMKKIYFMAMIKDKHIIYLTVVNNSLVDFFKQGLSNSF